MNVRPRAIVTGHAHWTSEYQLGTQHLARSLVRRGWDVAYLSQVITPASLLVGRERARLAEQWRIHRQGGIEDLDGHLWAYIPASPALPLRLSPVERHWQRVAVPNPVRLLRKRGFGAVDLLLLDTSLNAYLLDSISHRRSVLRVADRHWAAPWAARAATEHLCEVAARVDLVVYPGRAMGADMAMLGARRSLHLPNGIEIERFARPAVSPADLAALPRPVAIYVGAIEEWFDFALLERLSARMPDVSFVLIGPDDKTRGRLRPRPNVHLLGRRPAELVPAYLAAADVGLIPFDPAGHRELVAPIHPLKLYEYFAAGLPTVSADWDEIAAMATPAVLCHNDQEWEAAVRAAIAGGRDARLPALAAANTWLARIDTLLAAVALDAAAETAATRPLHEADPPPDSQVTA